MTLSFSGFRGVLGSRSAFSQLWDVPGGSRGKSGEIPRNKKENITRITKCLGFRGCEPWVNTVLFWAECFLKGRRLQPSRVFRTARCPRFQVSCPKGPFHTKNAIVMEVVVFCYRGSILLSMPIRCTFSQENNIQITIEVVNCYRCSDLLPVVFFSTAGSFGVSKPGESIIGPRPSS